MKKLGVVLLLIVCIFTFGCMPYDLNESFYAPNVYPNANNTGNVGSASMYWGNLWVTNINGAPYVGGGGIGDMVKATYDPANIGEQLVGLTAAQNLTNKQLTMNNGDSIFWKDAGGVPKQILFLGGGGFNILNPTGNGLNFNYNQAGEIYLWGADAGTGNVLVLYGSHATAGVPLMDSPTIDMGAWYWDGGAAAGWEATILHDMITAGATPKSQLKFSINSASILKLENDNGTVKTWLDGNLSITTGAIDMSQIGAEPVSTANRAGIYAIDLSPANCTIGFNTETAVLDAVAIVSTNKIPIRWNGVTYYLLVTTVP